MFFVALSLDFGALFSEETGNAAFNCKGMTGLGAALCTLFDRGDALEVV